MTTEVVQRDKPREHDGEEMTERTRSGATIRPRFDIWETEQELIMCGDMPGVAPEDVEVRFDNRELSIFGKVTPRCKDVACLAGEYDVANFYRTFMIGESIAAEKISAEMKNGVLTLHLPKTEAVKARRIEIKSS